MDLEFLEIIEKLNYDNKIELLKYIKSIIFVETEEIVHSQRLASFEIQANDL